MTWCNYGNVSGIVVELCQKHGAWVDEYTFGELTEFVSTLGGLISGGIDALRAPIDAKPGR